MMKQDDELHYLLAFRDQMFPILDCSEAKHSILIILLLKFAPALQEGYSTLFWNPTSTVHFFHAPLEHISVALPFIIVVICIVLLAFSFVFNIHVSYILFMSFPPVQTQIHV